MIDAGFPRFASSAAERLYALAMHNLQLLAMLEVVRLMGEQDVTWVHESAATLEAFAVRAAETELMQALDSGGRTRECLQAGIGKASLMLRSARQRGKATTSGSTSVRIAIAAALNRLVAACERLHEVVCLHDHPFEYADTEGQRQA